MNILITCIGVLQENVPVIEYNKGMISARITSEACCKYLLRKRGHAPDVIIALCTPNAYKETKVKNNLSGYSYFETAVRDFCENEKLHIPAFEIVKISKREESDNYYGKSIYKVRQLIQENALNHNTRIMFDTALKAHPINIMLQMLTRLLKNDGYKTIESYYAYPEKQCITADNTNHQLDIVEAISEFSSHGTAEKMCTCLAKNSRKKPDPIVVRLMESMQKFSDSIQLCQTECLQDILNNEIFPALEEVEKLNGASSMREDIFTLKLMAEDIRKKFGYIKTGDTFASSPMLLIEWCLKNRYIQQAVTLFVESIPKYLVNSGIIKYSKLITNQLNSPEVNLLYSQIILACYPKEKTPLSVIETSNSQLKRIQIELMNTYLQTGYVTAKDVTKIQLFVDTLNHFKQLIGDKRPKNAVQGYTPKNEAEKLLINSINTFDPTNYSKFLNTLKVKPNILIAFSKESEYQVQQEENKLTEKHDDTATEANEIDKKLCGIRNFTMKNLRSNLPGIKLNICRDKLDQFRSFLAHYVYIKKCVRNYLNHAMEYSDQLTAEQISEFKSYSVHTGALTIKNITENLTEAMRCLDSCIIKNHKSIRPIKKYYLTIPPNPHFHSYSISGTETTGREDNLSLKQYLNPMNSPFLDYEQTRFPIIPVISNTVQSGDIIKVYGIKLNSDYVSICEAELLAELDKLLIEKDFDYEYESIEAPNPSYINSSLNLFRTFTETVSEGDKIHVDMTCIENQISISLMMFMNYTIQYYKKSLIEAVVYGQYDNKLHSYALYDITRLIYVNNEISKISGTADPDDTLTSILNYVNQESETDVSEAADIADDIDHTTIKNDTITGFFPKNTELIKAKKYRFSSTSKYLRAVGRYRSDKKISLKREPIIKRNKHFC